MTPSFTVPPGCSAIHGTVCVARSDPPSRPPATERIEMEAIRFWWMSERYRLSWSVIDDGAVPELPVLGGDDAVFRGGI